MQMKVASALRPAWNYMVKVLFRPFALRKWLVWGLIAIIAMEGSNYYFTCGVSFDENLTGKGMIHRELHVPFQSNYSLDNYSFDTEVMSVILDNIARRSKPPTAAHTRGILAVLFSLALGLLLTWLSSVFSFLYIDDLCKNSYAIREPFTMLRRLGTSYFLWNLTLGMLNIGIMSGVMALTFKSHTEKGNYFSFIMHDVNWLSVSFAIIVLIMAVALTLANDFVVPAMYVRRIKIMEAWKVVLGIFRANVGQMGLYFLLIALIEIPTAIVTFGLCWLMMHAYSPLMRIWEHSYHPGSFWSTSIKGSNILIAVFYAVNYWLLRSAVQPVLVFRRAFSMAALGTVDPSLVTIPVNSTPSEPPTTEEEPSAD